MTRRITVEGDPDGLAAGPGSTVLVSLQDGPASRWSTSPTTRSSGFRRVSPAGCSTQANNDVIERDGTAFVSDYTGNKVAVLRLPGQG